MRRNAIVSAFVTAVTTASISIAPVSHSRSAEMELPSFEEIERSSGNLPAAWLEKQVVDRLQFLLGKGVSISKDQSYELSKLIDRISSTSKISERGLGVMAQLLTRKFNDAAFFETIPRPAIAQLMSAQSKTEEKLLEYAKNGKLPDSVLDGLMAEPGRVSSFARPWSFNRSQTVSAKRGCFKLFREKISENGRTRTMFFERPSSSLLSKQ